MFFVEVFELHEDGSGGWSSKDKQGAPDGFFADPSGLFPLPGLTDSLLPPPSAPPSLLSPSTPTFDWTWASSELTAHFAKAVGAKKVSPDGQWLTSLRIDASHYGEDGWQYGYDWEDSEWSRERSIGFLITAGSKVRRRRWIRPVIPSKDLAAFLIDRCALPSPLVLAASQATVSSVTSETAEACLKALPPVKPQAVRHLIIATHGVGSPTDQSLGLKLSSMRQVALDLCRAGYGPGLRAPTGNLSAASSGSARARAPSDGVVISPSSTSGSYFGGIDFSYCIWLNRSERLEQINNWLAHLHVPTSAVVRETAHRTMLQAALYMAGCGFQEDIRSTLEEEFNRAYCGYVATHPNFADRDAILASIIDTSANAEANKASLISHVSIFAHSLGGVISLDLLLKRPSYGLCFVPSHLFTMGSPIGVYFSLRGLKKAELESYLQRLYDGPYSTTSATNATSGSAASSAPKTLLHNIYSSQDAVAYLIGPLLWNQSKDGPLPPPATLRRPMEPSLKAEVNRMLAECCALDGRLAELRKPAWKRAAEQAVYGTSSSSSFFSPSSSLGGSGNGSSGGGLGRIEIKIKNESNDSSTTIAVVDPRRLAVAAAGAAKAALGNVTSKPEALLRSLGIGLPEGWDRDLPEWEKELDLSAVTGAPGMSLTVGMTSPLSSADDRGLHLGIGPAPHELEKSSSVSSTDGANNSNSKKTPLARAYTSIIVGASSSGFGGGSIDLPLPGGARQATVGEEALEGIVSAGSAALGKDVKQSLPSGFPGTSSVASASTATAAKPAGDGTLSSPSSSAGSGAGAMPQQPPSTADPSAGSSSSGSSAGSSLFNGFSTLAAVGDYLSAMHAHRVYWTSPEAMAHMFGNIIKSEAQHAREQLLAHHHATMGAATVAGGSDGSSGSGSKR